MMTSLTPIWDQVRYNQHISYCHFLAWDPSIFLLCLSQEKREFSKVILVNHATMLHNSTIHKAYHLQEFSCPKFSFIVKFMPEVFFYWILIIDVFFIFSTGCMHPSLTEAWVHDTQHILVCIASNMLFTYNRLGWLDVLITISGTHLCGATLDNSQNQTIYLDLQKT